MIRALSLYSIKWEPYLISPPIPLKVCLLALRDMLQANSLKVRESQNQTTISGLGTTGTASHQEAAAATLKASGQPV
jgi:hypothetical protein